MIAIGITRAVRGNRKSAGSVAFFIAANQAKCTDPAHDFFGDVPSVPHLFVGKRPFASIYQKAVYDRFNRDPAKLHLGNQNEYFFVIEYFLLLEIAWHRREGIHKSPQQFVQQCLLSSDVIDNLLLWLNLEIPEIGYYHAHFDVFKQFKL